MHRAILPGMLAGTLAFIAGCAGVGAEASLSWDGSGNGTHSEDAQCDSEGTLAGNGQVTDGDVRVTVEDAEGNLVFDETYTESIDVDDRTLSGHGGTWTIHAQRGGDDVLGDEFDGDYDFHLDCEGL